MADGSEVNGGLPEGPSFQEMAEATDASVFGMMTELRGNFPTLGGAVVAGTCAGLARYVLQGLPPGATGQQVLEAVAPGIRQAAQQVSDALRKAAGVPEPKTPPIAPLQTAFERLTALVGGAAMPTFVIRQEEHILLVSLQPTAGGVLSHASVVNTVAAMQRPGEVLRAHCTLAVRAWTLTEPEGLLARVRARMQALPHEGRHAHHVEGEMIALQWVVEQFAGAETPEGEDHDRQA